MNDDDYDPLDEVDIITEKYARGLITKEEAIKKCRKIWNQEGFKVDIENASIYLDIIKKQK